MGTSLGQLCRCISEFANVVVVIDDNEHILRPIDIVGMQTNG